MTRKQVLEALVEKTNLHDVSAWAEQGETFCSKPRFVAHKDGSFTVRSGYFYRSQGLKPEVMLAEVRKAFPQAQVVSVGDFFNAWPRESYFELRFTV